MTNAQLRIVRTLLAIAVALSCSVGTVQAQQSATALRLSSARAGGAFAVRPAAAEEPIPPPTPAPLPNNVRAPSLRDRLRNMTSGNKAPAAPQEPSIQPPAEMVPQPSAAAPKVRIPMAPSLRPDQVQIKQVNGRISLSVRDVPLNRLLVFLGEQLQWNIICADNLMTPVSLTLADVPPEAALSAICAITGCSWSETNGIIHVTNLNASAKVAADVQGRQLRVFRLDFASALDVSAAVKGLISPVGQCFTAESQPTNNRRTHEVVVVQDVPNYLQGIAEYIAQVDVPPRQVMIEAHVLAVDLTADCNLGIDFAALMFHDKAKLQLAGFASPGAPVFFSYDGADLHYLIDALRTQKDAKTLASPKVLVLNGQEARMQVGEKIAFKVQTTTETSTMESVSFLDVGVILRVTPRITRDGQVLMHVKPEVSKPLKNDDPDLPPNTDTTEVESSVMLGDGRGMVIGGLIKETDENVQQKVPFLGDIWVAGRLFQHNKTTRERKEIIITLLPRVVPDYLSDCDAHAVEVQRASSPLLQGALQPAPRPWEPVLPDAINNPARLRNQAPARNGAKPHAASRGTAPCAAGDAAATSAGPAEMPYYAGEGGLGAMPAAPLPGPYPIAP